MVLKEKRREDESFCTPEQFEMAWMSQCGACAICGNLMKPDGTQSTSVMADHCHNWFRFRGLLCGACNKGLGHFNDRADNIFNALKYLLRHGATQ